MRRPTRQMPFEIIAVPPERDVDKHGRPKPVGDLPDVLRLCREGAIRVAITGNNGHMYGAIVSPADLKTLEQGGSPAKIPTVVHQVFEVRWDKMANVTRCTAGAIERAWWAALNATARIVLVEKGQPVMVVILNDDLARLELGGAASRTENKRLHVLTDAEKLKARETLEAFDLDELLAEFHGAADLARRKMRVGAAGRPG